MNFQEKEKGIISVVTILAIGIFALGIVMISLTGSVKESAKNFNNKNGEQAFYTAEAAAREGVYQYKGGNFTEGNIPILNKISKEFIQFRTNKPDWPPEVIAEAKNNIGYYRKIIYVMNVNNGEAFNHAIFSESKLTLRGNAKVMNEWSSVFINDDIIFHGEATKTSIAGNVYSTSDDVDFDHVIKGEDGVIKVDDSLLIPDIDLSKYKDETNNDTYFDPKNDNDQDISEYINNKTITSIIYIIDESTTINVDSTSTFFTGNITTEGDLEIKGGTYTAGKDSEDNRLVAIYVDGDLTISGDAIINGVVYVTGETIIKGSNDPGGDAPEINGSLISKGEVEIKNNNVEINYSNTFIGDLQNILGLDSISAAPPTIKSWREE